MADEVVRLVDSKELKISMANPLPKAFCGQYVRLTKCLAPQFSPITHLRQLSHHTWPDKEGQFGQQPTASHEQKSYVTALLMQYWLLPTVMPKQAYIEDDIGQCRPMT